MANEPGENRFQQSIKMPAPTAWPMITALGISLALAGLVTHVMVSAVGVVLLLAGAVGWFREVLPEEHREAVPIVPRPAAVVPARVAVAQLKVGEQRHRASLPLQIYPYSAGIKGGIAGGVAMALLAVIHGLLAHNSIWYTINILAAAAMPKLAVADTATLSAFDPTAFVVALVIHGTTTLLIGLLYGIMLPMFPRHPAFFGGIVAPLLWTGLIWATLGILNPVLDERIEWRWFIASQLAFGLTAGFVVARSERIATLQSVPMLVRAGIEARGVMPPKEEE